MIDIRYHIISLISVFIALAIGILIGSSMAPSTTTKLVDAVKRQNEKVDSVLAEYERDHAVLGRLELTLGSMIRPLVRNRLEGRRVAIIQTGDQPDATRAAAEAISEAGGTLASTTTLTSVYDELSDEDVTRIRSEMPEEPTSNDPEVDLLRAVATAFRQGAADAGHTDGDLAVLRRERLITTDGDYGKPVSMVVIVGGTGVDSDLSAEPLAAREGDMIDLLTSNGAHVSVVGVESTNVANSSLTTYRNAGLATIDCIDRAIGKLDLIYALNGEKANYGVRAAADRILPASVEAELNAPRLAVPAPSTGFGVGH